jgi:UDP-glucose 4-epimerase
VSGHVVSFREIAERTVALLGSKPAMTTSLRSGPMPHNGYRPFDDAARRLTFLDFLPTPPAEGLARTCREALARATGD